MQDVVHPSELTILGMDRLLLVRCDLAGTLWVMQREGGQRNHAAIYTPIVASGTATFAYIGGEPNEIWLNIIGQRIHKGDQLCFKPGQIVISHQWTDVQRRITEDHNRITGPT